ncbi:MAG: hypothetical protein HY699_21135 [Deltaproteobacteria bacterium]|nr:hypothetical protein [Deltaproteobacteria bacterium]
MAADFGYTPGSFRVLCSQFRKSPDREFFLSPNRGPQEAPKRDPLRDTVVAARKQNMSIYDIVDALKKEGKELSPAGVWKILTEEGFARLPRRRDEERPPGVRVTAGEVADVRQLDLTPRTFRTQFGGLFLFVPLLVSMDLDNLLEAAGFPGSAMVPAGNAVRSLLGLKLFGKARNSHIMSHVLDEGLALFAGLTMIPKRSFLTEYSCRIGPESHVQLMRRWFGAVGGLGLEWGSSFDLDFHTIPFHGEDALIEKHYVSKRSRRQKGVLAFLARDADRQVFCYANGDLRIGEQNDEVLRFVEFWKELTGHYPEEVIFDSKLTTYANLSWLNQHDIKFMTLRRRSKKLMEAVRQAPPSAWRRIELDRITRAYRTPRVLDESITLAGYDGPLRQLAIADLGHEEPTLLLTNQLKRSAAKLVGRYAGRVLIENGIADGIDFFHMDALSSAVAMKVDCDLLLTLMASSLYRLFGTQIGRGYETAKSRRIFRDFIDASATVTVTNEEVRVRFQKRAHNPLLMAAGFQETDVHVPWLGGRRLRLILGERRGVNSQN